MRKVGKTTKNEDQGEIVTDFMEGTSVEQKSALENAGLVTGKVHIYT
jgi:hypothetical protein